MENTNVFNYVHEALDNHCSGNCRQCAFWSEALCGMVVIRSIMAKMNGSANVDIGDPYSDSELHHFINLNAHREE